MKKKKKKLIDRSRTIITMELKNGVRVRFAANKEILGYFLDLIGMGLRIQRIDVPRNNL